MSTLWCSQWFRFECLSLIFDLDSTHVLRLCQCAKETSEIVHSTRLNRIAVWLPIIRFLVRIYCICTVHDETNSEGFNCLCLNTQVREGRVEDGGRQDDCGAINPALAPNQQVTVTIYDKVHIVQLYTVHCSLYSSLIIIHCTLGSDLDSVETPPPRECGNQKRSKGKECTIVHSFR